MKVVRHIPTGKLVYAESPDFDVGMGIKNASILEGYSENELEEIEVTEEEWMEASRPLPSWDILKEITELTNRIKVIEDKVVVK